MVRDIGRRAQVCSISTPHRIELKYRHTLYPDIVRVVQSTARVESLRNNDLVVSSEKGKSIDECTPSSRVLGAKIPRSDTLLINARFAAAL